MSESIRAGVAPIAKRRPRGPRQQQETGKKSFRVNHQIRISPVRLVDEQDQQVGIVDLEEAKERAQQAGLDLVEVAPQASPPVCRVIDYGKWKYQQSKKEQKARSHSKQREVKEVRLRPKTDEHDLNIKTQKARDFLSGGDKVQFTMLFRGREMAHKEQAQQQMLDVAESLKGIGKIEANPKQMGRRMTMLLAPEQRSKHESGSGSASAGDSSSNGEEGAAARGEQ